MPKYQLCKVRINQEMRAVSKEYQWPGVRASESTLHWSYDAEHHEQHDNGKRLPAFILIHHAYHYVNRSAFHFVLMFVLTTHACEHILCE